MKSTINKQAVHANLPLKPANRASQHIQSNQNNATHSTSTISLLLVVLLSRSCTGKNCYCGRYFRLPIT